MKEKYNAREWDEVEQDKYCLLSSWAGYVDGAERPLKIRSWVKFRVDGQYQGQGKGLELGIGFGLMATIWVRVEVRINVTLLALQG